MVTPEMVLVVFLLRIGRSLRRSFGVSAFIISTLESMRVRWCLAAIWVLTELTSTWVGCGIRRSAFMTSRAALSVFKVKMTILGFN